MSHKQCYEKRELLVQEIVRLRAENARLKAVGLEQTDAIRIQMARAEVAEAELGLYKRAYQVGPSEFHDRLVAAEARVAALEKNAQGDLNTIRMMASESEILTAEVAKLTEMVDDLKGYKKREIERCHSLAQAWDALTHPAVEPTKPCAQCHGRGFIDEDEGITVECLKCAPAKAEPAKEK
jgi:hypothetical protein